MTKTSTNRITYLRWHYASKQVVEFLDGTAVGYYKVIGVDADSGTIALSPAYGKPKIKTDIPYKKKIISYLYDDIRDMRKEDYEAQGR